MKLLTFSHRQANLPKPRRAGFRKGFSIVEVAIAMAVVTLLLTTFLGVFGPAQKNIQRALSIKDINRMKDALSKEMSILRSSEVSPEEKTEEKPMSTVAGTYFSSFEKAVKMLKSSHGEEDENGKKEKKAVIIYQYRATPVDTDEDGVLPPYTGDGIQGSDYIVQTAVRMITREDDASENDPNASIKAELKAVEGPVFVVRMTQLVRDPDVPELALTVWKDDEDVILPGITDPDNPDKKGDQLNAATYPKAMVAFRAEFFKLNVNKAGYIFSKNWDVDKLGNALTEVNMGVRR